MDRKNKVAALVLCLLVGIVFRACYLADYDRIKPTRLGTVNYGGNRITVSLFCKSKPRPVIAPYEGEYRILELAQLGNPPLYFDLGSTIPDDRCRMEVYWYPTNNLLRFQDTQLAFAPEFRGEHVLDLKSNVLFCAVRQGSRITHLAKVATARSELSFPKRSEKDRTPHGYSGSIARGNQPPNQDFTIGEEEAQPIEEAWTADLGTLIGVIEPRGREQ